MLVDPTTLAGGKNNGDVQEGTTHNKTSQQERLEKTTVKLLAGLTDLLD